jgi:hypothetical protein
MIEVSGERFVEAACEQVWMVAHDVGCRGRWLTFHEQITEVVVLEPTRRMAWNTQDHPRIPRLQCSSYVTVELIPEGPGTRVRMLAAHEPATEGRLRALARRRSAQRAIERDIRRSLDELAKMLAGDR